MDCPVAFPALHPCQLSIPWYNQAVSPVAAMVNDAPTSPPSHEFHTRQPFHRLGKFAEISKTAPIPIPPIDTQDRMFHMLKEPFVNSHTLRTAASERIEPQFHFTEDHDGNYL